MKSIRHIALALFMTFASPAARADLEVGQLAPALDVELIDGKTLSARQLKGKVVVHLFWATWCPICTGDLPAYGKLHAAYQARGLEIVAIALDENRRDVADFWRSNGYTFPVAMRSNEIRQGFGRISGTPTLYLVDRSGKLRLKHIGSLPSAELERMIQALL